MARVFFYRQYKPDVFRMAKSRWEIERLYRLRYLHRGKHPVHSSAQLLLLLWLGLSRACAADSS